MSPRQQLMRLEVEKALLRDRIARRRAECADAFSEVLRPLTWVDRARVLWARAAPLLKNIFPAFVGGTNRPTGWLSRLSRWAPVFSALWRAFRPRSVSDNL